MIAPILSITIYEAVAIDPHSNLSKVSRVAPNHKFGSDFIFKNYRKISVLLFLTNSSKKHYALSLEFHIFLTSTEIFIKVNMANLRTNEQPTPYLNLPRSVTLH